MLQPTISLGHTASWVVKEKMTGKIIFETFNPAIPEKLNGAIYVAVPILEHLQSLNLKLPCT